jgi:hypothetical protein
MLYGLTFKVENKLVKFDSFVQPDVLCKTITNKHFFLNY